MERKIQFHLELETATDTTKDNNNIIYDRKLTKYINLTGVKIHHLNNNYVLFVIYILYNMF